MPCGPICPASDALCIAGFKQAHACQPPTRRSIACAWNLMSHAARGVIRRKEAEAWWFIIFQHDQEPKHFVSTGKQEDCCMILIALFWCPHSKCWTPKNQRFATPPSPHLSGNWAPVSTTRFPRHGAGNRGSISSKKPPSGNRSPIWVAHGFLLTSLGPYQLRQVWVASPAIHLRLVHGHPLRPQPGKFTSPRVGEFLISSPMKFLSVVVLLARCVLDCLPSSLDRREIQPHRRNQPDQDALACLRHLLRWKQCQLVENYWGHWI